MQVFKYAKFQHASMQEVICTDILVFKDDNMQEVSNANMFKSTRVTEC